MQHGKTNHPIEGRVAERHIGSALADDDQVLKLSPEPKLFRERAVNFHAGQVANTAAQPFRDSSIAWANFEYIRPKLESFQGPGQNALTDLLLPWGR